MLDWGLGFLGGLLNFARDPVGAVAGWTFDNVTEGIYEWLARGLAFAPLVFSASVLPVMRDSARRLIHLLVALVVSKLAIVISLVVAVQLAANAGAAETGGADTDAAAAVGTLVTGFACFLVAAISPMVLYRLMPTVEGAVASAGVVGGWGRAALSVGQAAVMAKGLGAAAAATRAVAGQRGGAGGLGRQQGAAGQRGGGGPESSGSPRVTGLAAATRAATSGQVASGSAGSQDRGATDGNLPPLPDAEPRGGAAPWVAPGRARRGLAHRRAALHHQHRRGRWCGSERARRRGRWASTSTGGPTAGQAVGTSRCACIGRQAGRHRKGLRVGGGRTVSTTARSYTFGDASPPGILLGLPMRQAVPVVAGVLWLAVCLQTPLGIAGGLVGPLAGATVAFGRWRGSALVETVGPATRIALGRRTDRARWHRPPLLGTTGGGPVAEALPPALAGLELIDALPESDELTGRRAAGMAAVRDRRRHTLTAAIQVTGRGFPLAAGEDQDRMLAGWGAALSPLARDRSPVIRVVWQAWAGPADMSDHHEFLALRVEVGSGG